MDLATLTEKLAGLEKQHAQMVANANAVGGAIQFCKQLIEEQQQPAPAAQEAK